MFQNRHRYYYIALLAGYSFVNVKFTEGDKILSQKIGDGWLLLLISLMTFIIWEGNRFIQKIQIKEDSKLSIRLIIHFIASVFLVLGLSFISSFEVGIFTSNSQSLPGFRQTLGFTFRINLFLHCINAIYVYNEALAKTRLEAQALKQESTIAKLDALRKQINPHFLFNSLNVLTSVIEEDPKIAVRYVKELSAVYRYLLGMDSKHLVTLAEELKFIEAYAYLLKIRFQDSLAISISVHKQEDQFIPPSTLQLLIENAIKHNEVSSAHPLTVEVSQQNGHLLVSNNVNTRRDKQESTGVGLSNIENRYRLISKSKPEIEQSNRKFVVRLPVLTKDSYESHNNRG